jgi:hypothetical protein
MSNAIITIQIGGKVMSGKILQINFKFNVTASEYVEAVTPLASDIADVPGMLWKVWLMNEAENEAGGIYWFQDEESLKAYLDGPIVAGIASHPALEDISVKAFDSISQLSEITNGPVFSSAA